MTNQSRHSAFIIDDSKSARVMLSRMLIKSGYSVSEFESGDDFLSHKHDVTPPNLIFMDHMMPGTDGLRATKLLKQDGKFKDIPVIMYTSHDDQEYVNDLKQAGANGILHKPAKQAELTEILSNPALIFNSAHASNKKSHSDTLLVDTIKKVKALQVQVEQLANENKQLRDALNTKSSGKDNLTKDGAGHGSHITQDALTASIRQLTKQFDEKLHLQDQKVTKQLSNVGLGAKEKQELEHSLSSMAQRIAEKTSEKIAINQAQAVSAKVAAAQSDLITRDALQSITAAVRTPTVLATLCILLTLFSIGLHFVG